MRLHCPECRQKIYADDINIVQTIAKCKSCNNIFEFTEQLANAGLPVPHRRKPEIFNIPPGIDVLKLMNELEIKVTWRRAAKYFSPFIALFWNLFVFFHFMVVYAFSGLSPMFIFYLPFFLIGFFLIYQSIGLLINKTYITVDAQRILVEHKPITFLLAKDQYYPSKDIAQVFVRRHEVGKKNGHPVHAWAVDIKTKSGETICLLKELHALEYAQFIEQEIEQHLVIKDEPVEGEWGNAK
ncbi:MAG: hypothetical protein AAGJ18_12410 [Bacteroidota bacterium]